ncbi:MAG: hypothetical protein ACJAWF_001507 [Candidatus Azotimanducaceae bacterium]|jgi:hypothetical protein
MTDVDELGPACNLAIHPKMENFFTNLPTLTGAFVIGK